jgi:ABC-type glycerol-3-phosphate transport system substrate-binding protein
MREKLQVLIASGTPPDVWEYATIAETMVRYGWLVPIDDYIRRDRVDLSVYPRTLYDHVARYQGRIWLLPYGHGGNTMVMACNRALFNEAGIALPGTDLQSTWTWGTWVEALRQLTRRQGDEVGVFGQGDLGSWVSYPMLWQTDWLTEDLKTVVCDSPEMIECYTRYFAMATTHRVAPRPGELTQRFGVQNAIQAFNTGKVAMTNLPPYAVRSFTDQKYVDLALAPRPRARVSVPDVNWHSFGVIQGSRQVDAAWTLIRWLTDEARWARFVYKIPAQAGLQRPWLEEQFRLFDAPRLEAITNSLAAAVPQTRLFRLTAWPQVAAAVNEAFARLWAGQAEPAAVLRDLKPQLQAIIDR